jgi:hypothetical protein
MINFFRKIRRQLASENKFQKYFRYAFGEILLVVIGILIALQVNNWNEKRKQDTQFKVTMEQVYNGLNFEANQLNAKSKYFQYQMYLIDSLLNYATLINEKKIPLKLYLISISNEQFVSETHYHITNLNYNPNNPVQNEISKQIIRYANLLDKSWYNDVYVPVAQNIKEAGIPYPRIAQLDDFSPFINMNSLYTNTEIKRAQDLLTSEIFRADLSSLQTGLQSAKVTYWAFNLDAVSIMETIKNYYPEVKLLFKNVGIKGTAIDGFDNVNGKSTPMVLTNEEQSIWEVDIYLLKGVIKFRCNDSWAQNWGGNDFPEGFGFQDGPDITIPEAGNYHIIFKPETGEYEFIKQDE